MVGTGKEGTEEEAGAELAALEASPAPLFDTHCHLNLQELGERPDVYWERARQAGVTSAVVIGIDVPSSRRAVDLAASRPGLYAAVGIHPNEASLATAATMAELRELAGRPEVVALGESGLDLYWDRAPRADQERSLDLHVELALELDLPLVLHIRDAYELAARRLEDAAEEGLRGVIHCFAGKGEEVVPFVEWGWPISFSGILTYSGATNVRDGARRTPLEQCLVETDSPWLTPVERRGQLNEPAWVVFVARRLATVHGVSETEVAEVTTRNARRVFGLDR